MTTASARAGLAAIDELAEAIDRRFAADEIAGSTWAVGIGAAEYLRTVLRTKEWATLAVRNIDRVLHGQTVH